MAQAGNRETAIAASHARFMGDPSCSIIAGPRNYNRASRRQGLAFPPKWSFDPAGYVRFNAAGQQVGWLRPELAARLTAWPAVFESNPGQVTLLKKEALP